MALRVTVIYSGLVMLSQVGPHLVNPGAYGWLHWKKAGCSAGGASLARGSRALQQLPSLPGWVWVEVRGDLPEMNQRKVGPRKGERSLVKKHYEFWDGATPDANANCGSYFIFQFGNPNGKLGKEIVDSLIATS